MNLLDARLEAEDDALVVRFGSSQLPVAAETLAARPDLRPLRGTAVVLGIRPEDLEDARWPAGAPADGACG